MKDFNQFKEDLGQRESSNDYRCKNAFGFLGRWQFGKPRLWDLGLSIDGWHPRLRRKKTVISEIDFLLSKSLQDEIFKLHIEDLTKKIRKKYSKNYGKSFFVTYPEYQAQKEFIFTESGLVAGAHLKGMGGVKKFLKGKDNADGLGTKISEYISLFGGYDLTIS